MAQEVAERSGFSFNVILRAIRGELHPVELVCDLDQLADPPPAASDADRLAAGGSARRSALPRDATSDLRGSGRQRTRRSP